LKLFSDWLSEKISLKPKNHQTQPAQNTQKKPILKIFSNPNTGSNGFDDHKKFRNFPKNKKNRPFKNSNANFKQPNKSFERSFKKNNSFEKPEKNNSKFNPKSNPKQNLKFSPNPRGLIGFDSSRPFYQGPSKNEPPKLRISPVGGTNEVGQNCMLVEYGQDMILIDLGLAFPGRDSLGVNYFIPDLEYVYKHAQNLKGIVITHGHLDHIGAIPYVIEKLGLPPIYATKLTAGLIKNRLEEFKLNKLVNVQTFNPMETLVFGGIKVGFFRVAHSIPDSVGVYVKTDTGSFVHSGDFKFCDESSDGIPQDLEKMRKLGEKNIDLLLSDSTNTMKPGKSIPDKIIAENLDKIISQCQHRIIVATFSSQLGRMQELLNSAIKHHKTVFVSGRSIETNLRIAKDLGYIKYPEGLIKDSKEAKNTPLSSSMIICTGSQGETQASIIKMIKEEHEYFKILATDTVIFSSSPIPGNEVEVHNMIDNLSRLGAKIIHSNIIPVHTSGHAYVEECKELIRLIKPKHFAPIHGNHFMRSSHRDIAMSEGIDKNNIFLIDNGDILEIHNSHINRLKERLPARYVIVDGNSKGVDGSIVLKDRKILSEGGVLVVHIKIYKNKKLFKTPFLYSKGLFYDNEISTFEPKIIENFMKNFNEFTTKNPKSDLGELKYYIARTLTNFISRKLDRAPLVMPIIEVVR